MKGLWNVVIVQDLSLALFPYFTQTICTAGEGVLGEAVRRLEKAECESVSQSCSLQ